MSEPQLISVELDCLLDTRLGLIAMHKPEFVDPLLKANYRNRKTDRLELLVPTFPGEWFRDAYAKRDKEVLKHSRLAPSVSLLSAMTNGLEVQKYDTPYVEKIEVEINYYPYKLTKAEIKMLCDVVYYYCSAESKVTAVSRPIEDYTPTMLKDKYGGLIVYSVDKWVTAHHQELMRTKIPTVTICGPTLYLNHVPSAVECTFDERGALNLFAGYEDALVEHVGLNFVDTALFSLVDLAQLEKNEI